MIILIDVIKNKIQHVSDDFKISFDNEMIAIKDLNLKYLKIYCVIINYSETDFLYKKV